MSPEGAALVSFADRAVDLPLPDRSRRYSLARALAGRAWGLLDRGLGTGRADGGELATVRGDLAAVLADLADPGRADAFLRTMAATAGTEAKQRLFDGLRVGALHRLAETLRALGRRGEAVWLTCAALTLAGAGLGHDHPQTAALWRRLGALLAELGETENASSCYEAALAVHRRAGLRAGAEVDLTLPDLALLYDVLGHPA